MAAPHVSLLFQPFFHHQSLEGHAALMAASAERLAGALGAAADSGAVVDIWCSFGALTFDVVGTTAFGVNFDTLARLEEDDTAPIKAGNAAPTIKSAAAEKLVAAARTAFAVGGVANWPVLFQFLFPHFDAPLRVLTSRIPTPLRRQVPWMEMVAGMLGAISYFGASCAEQGMSPLLA